MCEDQQLYGPLEVRVHLKVSLHLVGPCESPWPVKRAVWECSLLTSVLLSEDPATSSPLSECRFPSWVCVCKRPKSESCKVDTNKGWLRLPENRREQPGPVCSWEGCRFCLSRAAPGGDTLERIDRAWREATWSSGRERGALGGGTVACGQAWAIERAQRGHPSPRTLIRDLSRFRRCLKRFRLARDAGRCGCSPRLSTEYDHPGPICSQRPRSTLRDQILISHFPSAWGDWKAAT